MKNSLKKKLFIKVHWFLSSQIGLDVLLILKSMRGTPSFIKDLSLFLGKIKTDRIKFSLKPCLHDRFEEGGVTKTEYFWQDLIVAKWIFEANPVKHVDIGSRLDGFVAHVASFRSIEVFDVRNVTTQISGIIFRQIDITNSGAIVEMSSLESNSESSNFINGYCDSLSCLHVLEHLGLGRYGDQIDLYGYRKGLSNMAKLVKPNGTFYLSTPVGQERVEFNANWVFNPITIVNLAKESELEVTEMHIFNPSEGLVEYPVSDESLSFLASQVYNLGIFIFKKVR